MKIDPLIEADQILNFLIWSGTNNSTDFFNLIIFQPLIIDIFHILIHLEHLEKAVPVCIVFCSKVVDVI